MPLTTLPATPLAEVYDVAVIGGGINGVGIAADAAGRGLSVFLCEKDDLASHTSSASSKLIHGGLRYLEHYEFRLVREALAERDLTLSQAAHPDLDPILAIQSFYVMAAGLARARGLDPDQPRFLSKVTRTH